MRRINYRHYICIAITLGFIACAFLLFPSAFGRIVEGGRDFGLSIAYYFCELFYIPHGITPTVNNLPSYGSDGTFLPDTYEGFASDWSKYWQLWANGDNVLAYLGFLCDMLYYVCLFILVLLPFVLLFRIIVSNYFKRHNNNYDRDSRPLRAFKTVARYTYIPIKHWLSGLFAFVRERRYYLIIWLCIWAFNFNFFTIILEFFAFYFYFAVSFDIVNIYRQVYKLALDLMPVLTFVPLWVWVAVGLYIVDRVRKGIAYRRLNHFERRNRGFINARPIVSMTCGTMGKRKTTTISDMALSQEVMFRDKAFEKILENDLKFPYFPWINLENQIKTVMERHEVYNLATVRRFIRATAETFVNNPSHDNIFGYDYERYGLTYDDKNKVVDIWVVLETYAQLYFIYIIQSSLIISNYSVRVDNVLSDLGNFPLWNSDFFKRDSRLIDSFSRHAHILDFDTLRLGKKVVENNNNSDGFEFGVILITEVGKERKNNLELKNKEVKASAKQGNQMNDGFNDWLKMIRHSATVDNFPFVKVFTDEQRPESWGADARDLCEIVHIKECGETRLAMPFFSLGELLHAWLFGKFSDLYYTYRYNRGDNTLLMYILKAVTAKAHHYYTNIYNRFGYSVLKVQVENGTQDGQLSENKYFLMNKKIYSKRFSTDCFSDFFAVKALRSPVGLNDLPEYATEKATISELEQQNSYFIRDLVRGFNRDNEE